MATFLQNKKYFEKYRVVADYDLTTNDYPRTEDGLIDKSFEDVYIKCRYGNQIYHYGKGKKRGQHILVAYIPSRQRGKNILESLNEDIYFDVEITDKEVLFKFEVHDLDVVAEKLKAFTNRKDADGNYKYISPFSTKNLPKTKYNIPDEDLTKYKNIIKNIPQNKMYLIAHITKDFTKEKLCDKRFTEQDLKKDQKKCGLKGRNYIHFKGLFDEYCDYLEKHINTL